ncbi:sigma-70 family RNA polymerase sigma factor [Frigidibacter sp. MR17.24]|uniref:sigma-70 family RNA polymerase sigma factor n=1 Tax=Frigidibacter sp. MR17.24 TaxID=3127345 RepID=UPI003012D85E
MALRGGGTESGTGAGVTIDGIAALLPALRRHARAMLGDAAAADDLVQDVLERALATRAQWRGEGSLKGWLFRIMVNLHRDGLRRQAARVRLVQTDSLPERAVSGGQDGHLRLREVEAAMQRLPEDQRQALLLVAIEGLSLSEAAAVVEVPEGTLVSRLGRARAALREMTGETPEPRPGARRVMDGSGRQ